MAQTIEEQGVSPVTGGQPVEPHSLFGEILDWMLAPLLFLWPISIVATNHVANQIADLPYDRQLGDRVVAISRQVETHGTRISVNLPGPARDMLRGDEDDTTYFQVIGPGGELVIGDSDIPRVEVSGPADDAQTVRFRDARIHNEETRVAYQFVPAEPGRPVVLVQVAETRHKREQLASRIISGVLLPQFAIIPLAVMLVWLGLTRGLAPLKRLQLRIRRRRPDDLSPIQLRNVPEELRPVIAAFNDMMARLEDNLEAQHRFIAAAAHQLKTPLTGLKTQTELALQETDCMQLHDYLQRISGGVDRAAHLTSQLLQLARAEASHETVRDKEPVDLQNLVREVTAHCVPRALARNIDLGFEAAEAEMIIFGVPLLLREMIDNLVDNAIKYTPEGGRVTVRLHAVSDWILEVEDTGIGIAREDRPRIFERFYRALGTDAEGSGLGLAIVREIADLHRASIEVLDNPGERGTVIRLIFDNGKNINTSLSLA
jgi:two-component system sensor histidine kinase TctE